MQAPFWRPRCLGEGLGDFGNGSRLWRFAGQGSRRGVVFLVDGLFCGEWAMAIEALVDKYLI
jgi:hypothetical protein